MCGFEVATLVQQKLHGVAATKIASVNGPLQVGGPEHFRHSKEVSMATLRAGTTPACSRHLASSH